MFEVVREVEDSLEIFCHEGGEGSDFGHGGVDGEGRQRGEQNQMGLL